MTMACRWTTVPLLALAAATACARPGPRPLVYDADTCARCLMTVSDRRFGAELVSRTGKVRAFDSVECLAGYVTTAADTRGATAWVTDITRPGRLIPAQRATYVRRARVGRPMGLGLAALDPQRATERARPELSGPTLTWAQVLALVARGDS